MPTQGSEYKNYYDENNPLIMSASNEIGPSMNVTFDNLDDKDFLKENLEWCAAKLDGSYEVSSDTTWDTWTKPDWRSSMVIGNQEKLIYYTPNLTSARLLGVYKIRVRYKYEGVYRYTQEQYIKYN